MPIDWAATQANLGLALQVLRERESDTARLEGAASAFKAALIVFRDAKADYPTQQTERALQRVQTSINQQKNRKVAHY
ncbi:hypothetical protein AB4Y32_31910 [Paraburkholderia phymatum]|uniref:Uncharacterized protein n=1 Tax=Paraburkholderia phymatum TaxID=148447 RepID=A0ACC6U9N5_9BURK